MRYHDKILDKFNISTIIYQQYELIILIIITTIKVIIIIKQNLINKLSQ